MSKKFTFLFYLLSIIILFGSFKTKYEDESGHYKNNGYFFAILNGTMFEMRDEDKYRAELINKTATLNGTNNHSLNRVAASLIFYGNEFKAENGRMFGENIEFEYTFDNGSLGEPKDLKIEIHCDLHDYYQIPDLTKFVVKSLTFSDDRREFIMSADFDCRMRRWGFPAESQPIVRVKGRMVNIIVTVPPWVKIKEPTQVAGN